MKSLITPLLALSILTGLLACPALLFAATGATPASTASTSIPHQQASALAILHQKDVSGHHRVMLISNIEFESAMAYRVQLLGGSVTTLLKTQVLTLFRYPDPKLPLQSSEHQQRLQGQKTLGASLALSHPAARPYLEPLVGQMDLDLNRFAQGEIRIQGGSWQSQSDLKAANTAPGGSQSLTINGVAYQNADIMRIDGSSIVVRHDGGIARIPWRAASPEVLAKIRSNVALMGAMHPLIAWEHEGKTLKQVIWVGEENGRLILLHHEGLFRVTRSTLADSQITELTGTNPSLQSTLAAQRSMSSTDGLQGGAKDSQQSENSDSSLPLLFKKPDANAEFDRRLGWPCPPDIQQRWLQASSEPFSKKGFDELLGREPGSTVEAGPPLDDSGPLDLQEILQFVNNKLVKQAIGYNEQNRCFVIKTDLADKSIVLEGVIVEMAFDAPKLNAEVRVVPAEGERGYYVVLEGYNGQDAITLFQYEYDMRIEPGPWWREVSQIPLMIPHEHDAVRVARAMHLLLSKMGAKESKL